MPSPVFLLLWFSIASLAIYKYVLVPALLSPLARIPKAHWSASISNAWIKYHRLNNRGTFVVHEAHQKYGQIIRLAPDEISVNCVDGGLRTIYTGGYEKQQWYDIFRNYDIAPMFAMDDRGAHSKRKRMVSNLYGKSFLSASQPLAHISRVILEDRLLPTLVAVEARGDPIEAIGFLSAITMDFVCAYTMGLKNGTNFLGDLDHAITFNHVFHELQKDTLWLQEMPSFTKAMKTLGLEWLLQLNIPDRDKYKAEPMVLDMCDRAEATVRELEKSLPVKIEDYPTVYIQLRSGLIKEAQKSDPDLKINEAVDMLRKEIASELLDHTMAGYDTSSITLAFLTWQLSKKENLHWQDKLHAELIGTKHDPRTIDMFPVLHAVVMETLRLNSAIPGNQPRITPANATLGPPGQVYPNIPANIRVQAQAYSLHRNPEVFPESEAWLPQRWIDASEDQRKEMGRWFWAFGSGGRMCVGSNLAMLEMKAVVKTIWTNFTTSIDFDAGMDCLGSYVAPPISRDGKTLMIRLKKRV